MLCKRRFYSPYPVVEMDYERREMAYLALGEYQSGSNASSSKFGFTQPVVMQYHADVSQQHTAWTYVNGGVQQCTLCCAIWPGLTSAAAHACHVHL
jgi:hypothetical protein